MDLLLRGNSAINKLQFHLVARSVNNDIDKIYCKLMKNGLDDISKGFWIYDIKNNRELYSPNYRASLQYSGEKDFPNVPESWQQAIHPDDVGPAVEMFHRHVDSRGEIDYLIQVRYRRKYEGEIIVWCQGDVVAWGSDGEPLVMIGVHLNSQGLYGR